MPRAASPANRIVAPLWYDLAMAKPLQADRATLGLQLFAIFALPWILLYVTPHKKEKRSPLARQIDWLRSTRVEYLFVGNSMLDSRIDPELFTDLAGKTSIALAEGSSGAAHWYLTLKNVVLPSGVRPKKVFLFFRSGELTDLPEDLDTISRRRLATLMNPGELLPVVPGLTGVRLALAHAVETPLVDLREWFWREFHHPILNPTFGDKKIRVRNEAVRPPRPVSGSFLSKILDLPVPLAFVRVARNPRAAEAPDEYFRELREFISSKGAQYYDFGRDPEVTEEMYAGDDHLLPAHRPRYTRLFHERISKELE